MKFSDPSGSDTKGKKNKKNKQPAKAKAVPKPKAAPKVQPKGKAKAKASKPEAGNRGLTDYGKAKKIFNQMCLAC